MSSSSYRDYIVLGVGGAGASTLYWLTKLAPGKTIVGIEQFELNHKKGSSHDYSRLIRSFYDDPNEVAFVKDAFACWKTLEEDTDAKIYHRAGGYTFTDNAEIGKTFDAYIEALKSHPDLGCREVSKSELTEKFPQFNFNNNMPYSRFLYDPVAGYIEPMKAIAKAIDFVNKNNKKNCTILEHTKVLSVTKNDADGLYTIQTASTSGGSEDKKATFTTSKLIVTAGAWSRDLLAPLGIDLPFEVYNEQMSYYAVDKPENYQIGTFPVFCALRPHEFIYGGPILGDINGLKIATHISYGEVVPTGDERSYDVNARKARATDEFLQKFLPGVDWKKNLLHKRCLYTVTPDHEPLVTSLEAFGHPNMYLFAGSGGGFKFTSAIGRFFAESAVNGKSTMRVPPRFQLERPAFRDPNFVLHDYCV